MIECGYKKTLEVSRGAAQTAGEEIAEDYKLRPQARTNIEGLSSLLEPKSARLPGVAGYSEDVE